MGRWSVGECDRVEFTGTTIQHAKDRIEKKIASVYVLCSSFTNTKKIGNKNDGALVHA